METLCTNRDLPLQIATGQGRTDFSMEKNAPYDSIRCVGVPAAPKASNAEGEIAWRAISHLSLNYLSLTDPEEGRGGAALQDILKLYSDMVDPQIRKQIEGVISVNSKPIVRRIVVQGQIAFVRGLEVTVVFDESFYEGTGVFLLGAVLEQFFARYVTINSFTETVVKTLQRGEVKRWPMRIGTRHIL
jgi:type VI secretion system protein ImpG